MTSRTVVILLSDKRSGSTMFARELCRHPAVATVAYSPHTYQETHHWLKGAVLLGMAPQTFAGGKVYSGYGSATNARAYLVDCVKQNVPEFVIPLDDRALVFEGWEVLCERFAQPVFFEKSPQILAHWAALSLLLEWIQQTTFKVRIIGLSRNPLAVQYSAYQLFHTDPEVRQYGWLKTQLNMLAFQNLLPEDAFLHVRYEDIIAAPVITFAKVCDFIGLPHFSEMGSMTHTESLTKWREDPYFNFQLDPIVKQIAHRLGYEDEELENAPKPVPPILYRLRNRWQPIYHLNVARLKDRLLKPFWLRFQAVVNGLNEK